MDKNAPIKKFFWFLAVNVFWLVLVLILLDVLMGLAVFYKYAFYQNAQNQSAPTETFKNDDYQKIIGNWEQNSPMLLK